MAENATAPTQTTPGKPPATPTPDPKLKVLEGGKPPLDPKAAPPAKPGETTPAVEPKEGQTPPAEGEQEGAAAEVPQEPELILFDLELEDGTKREVSAKEAAEAIALTEKALQAIDDNKKLATREQNFIRNLGQKPLHTIRDTLAAVYFEGDLDAAYEHLMQFVRAAYEEEQKYLERPAEERQKEEYERKLKRKDERLQAYQKRDAEEREAALKAQRLAQLKTELDQTIADANLPDTEEARDLLIAHLKQQRAAGRRPNFAEAAKTVRAIFEKREEDLLRRTDAERLKKIRPDLAEALEKSRLEQVLKDREEETKKPSSPPPSREPKEERSQRVAINRW